MPRVLQCVQWDDATQTCATEAWIEQASILDALPTVEQANAVGLAIFLALAGIAAQGLLLPPREIHDA